MTAGLFPEAASIQFGTYRFLYSFHMPLFFMISGFAFSTSLPIVLAACLKRFGLHDAVFRPACFVRSLASRGAASAG